MLMILENYHDFFIFFHEIENILEFKNIHEFNNQYKNKIKGMK